ncbi:MAG: nitronate monooxygenase [Firmicutes bacterium]|nr:nitronate monooxygenase [Bacillota bacterium]
MGVGISSWKLARTVAMYGQMGVVSGTALAFTLARRLMDGDPEGHLINALDHFPFHKIANRIKEKYLSLVESDKKNRYRNLPMPSLNQSRDLTELTVVANFAEVFMAKNGHKGLVGINFLEKIQIPTLPSIYGALLAGVDYILMGAGIPARMPLTVTELSLNHDISLPIKITEDASEEPTFSYFSPKAFADGEDLPNLSRPQFLAIVSSVTLATHLHRSSYGSPDGFVVEAPIAGGHNAPPRGKTLYNEQGEPIYGDRDIVDISSIAKIGLPFWLAGGYGSKEQLEFALAQGASGVQVGTAFALCEESGFESSLKDRILKAIGLGKAHVKTDPLASPTGFPFKVVELEGTIGENETGEKRKRICDLGYLRETYRKKDGTIGYRCPSEHEADFVAKGGKIEDTIGRRCLCNGLASSMGIGQKRQDGSEELPLITAGDDLKYVLRFLKPGKNNYHAVDVLSSLLGKSPSLIT